ncbi:unnamed protein product [Kuraishia capsulata CBS 1993]|uniref:AAA+ ATPase domain-containing protein n=1 Tax=Kuraishia capsulata CBS 1993 TaxID=1382522 RepID=W6MGS4_9ASCO|nr:uncharacterized protein KUCA_T00001013001 [Kuraishia capsulata CBS 1993]CDK25046.1 unnamed protein product [Kuraishia capsulata CBS 1993]
MSTHETLAQAFQRVLQIEKRDDYEATSQLIASSPLKKLEAKGLAILNLCISNLNVGLNGKIGIELIIHPSISGVSQSSKEKPRFSRGDFKLGDIVQLQKYQKQDTTAKLKNSSKSKDNEQHEVDSAEISGIVTKTNDTRIMVSINLDQTSASEKIEEKLNQLYNAESKVSLVKLSNSVTYNRMDQSLKRLEAIESKTRLMRILLGDDDYQPPTDLQLADNLKSVQFVNQGLNESQKAAVNFSLVSPITIVHGPPGTGKTSTIVEMVRQLAKRKDHAKINHRILICGPSNVSVDTILERLTDVYQDNSKILRLGHPSRLLKSILDHSLDIIVENNDTSAIIKDIIREINTTTHKVKKMKSYRERREAYSEIKLLKKDLRIRSKSAISDVIKNCEIVICTLHGSSSRELFDIVKNGELFDTLIIDEVSQSLEPQCWIPLMTHLGLERLIIAGDDKQLSPMVNSKDHKVSKVLTHTLFDRLVKLHGGKFLKFLNVQYRMNDLILQFPNSELYDGQIVSAESVKDQTCLDLKDVKENDDTTAVYIWYDTQGGLYQEYGEEDEYSKFNENECTLVLNHVESLIKSGVQESAIGIIAPYSAQISKLKGILLDDYPGLEISTVDGFQGREKEIIVLSLVRSNDNNEVGFLADFKRLNVSITRCKKQLCVVGDMECLSNSKNKFLKDWVEWCEDNAEIRYPDVL